METNEDIELRRLIAKESEKFEDEQGYKITALALNEMLNSGEISADINHDQLEKYIERRIQKLNYPDASGNSASSDETAEANDPTVIDGKEIRNNELKNLEVVKDVLKHVSGDGSDMKVDRILKWIAKKLTEKEDTLIEDEERRRKFNSL